MDNLPKGTIIMWNEAELPSDKWKWFNGFNSTPNLKYRFHLGDKGDGNEEGKPEGDPDKNDGIFRKNNVPKHRHPLNGEGENGTFPKLEHNHGGETLKSGKHKHEYYFNLGSWNKGLLTKGPDGVEMDNRYNLTQPRRTTDTSGNQIHRINTSLEGADNEIKDHIVGEGPIYGEGEEQKPFYPHYTLINFIMKVE